MARVDWRGTERVPAPAAQAGRGALAEAVDCPAPGVAALFDGVGEDRTHSVLDVGLAAEASLRVYARFARRIRFADLLDDGRWPREPGAAARAFAAVPAQPACPYDLVFAWDALDRLFPEDRPRLVQELAAVTAPGARLHLVVRSQEALPHGLRFTLLDTNRIRYESAVAPPLPQPRLLPAPLAKLLLPFNVVHAFTLKSGLREYLAVRAPA